LVFTATLNRHNETALRTIPLQDPVVAHARSDYPSLRLAMTVGEGLAAIRQRGLGERIIYFYVVDDDSRLAGVVPTRRLLTSELDKPLAEIMIAQVIAIPHSATVLEACEFFVMHKFLAFPIVDEQRIIRGVVDVSLFAEELFDLAETEKSDAVFEALGFHIAQLRGASPLKAFRFRFPWLLATVASGSLCALLTSVYEVTLANSLVLAFFLAMVLGLAESVGVQSLTVAIQALRGSRPNLAWYLSALRREIVTAVLLGSGCGLLVGLIVWAWRGGGLAAAVIGSGVFFAVGCACVFGLSVPALLHAFRLDPKIAAGPITLALTDLCTLLFYFTLAALVL
jgi:magnesium transporter